MKERVTVVTMMIVMATVMTQVKQAIVITVMIVIKVIQNKGLRKSMEKREGILVQLQCQKEVILKVDMHTRLSQHLP